MAASSNDRIPRDDDQIDFGVDMEGDQLDIGVDMEGDRAVNNPR